MAKRLLAHRLVRLRDDVEREGDGGRNHPDDDHGRRRLHVDLPRTTPAVAVVVVTSKWKQEVVSCNND